MNCVAVGHSARISAAARFERARRAIWDRATRYGDEEKRPPSSIARWVVGGVIGLLVLVLVVVPALQKSEHPVVWELVHVASEEPVVVIRALRPSCEEVPAPSVEESDEEVSIGAVSVQRGRPVGCPAIVAYSYFVVELQAPLGNRKLEGCLLEGPCRESLLPRRSSS